MDLDTIIGLLRLALITATPIALGAYAGIMSERAGIVNIAIAGMMLTSAIMSQLVAMSSNLSKISILGELFCHHQPIVYAMLILTFVIHYVFLTLLGAYVPVL